VIALRRTILLGVLIALLAGAAPLYLYAAEEAGSDASHHETTAHHDEGHHVPALGDLLFPAINFSIYLVIVVRYVVPAMREYLRRRRADIVQVATESSAALATAEQTIAASKARLAALKSEADGIRQDLVAIAERQAKRLIAEAEETGSRRLADASLVAEQERRRAGAQVRADIARAAAALAEQQIRAALTPDDQRNFVQKFLKDATAS
jgi:F0F1-type ATP synthase membrane subunit b/b'